MATLYNYMKFSFSQLDLSNISIPYANLQNSICEKTNFKNADLSNVILNNSCLNYSNFSNANLFNIKINV